jgi:cell division protein FtsL
MKGLGFTFLSVVVIFLLLVLYLNLNLTSINYGYQLQRLRNERDAVKEEIDQLLARKASLLSLQRVEDVVTRQLKYQYPQGDQYIKVFSE